MTQIFAKNEVIHYIGISANIHLTKAKFSDKIGYHALFDKHGYVQQIKINKDDVFLIIDVVDNNMFLYNITDNSICCTLKTSRFFSKV